MKKDIDILTPILPPYYVVTTCAALGFDRPQDSRWQHIPRNSPFFGKELMLCACVAQERQDSQGSHLKASKQIEIFIHRCLFHSEKGSDVYRIGQCPACRTIYWSED